MRASTIIVSSTSLPRSKHLLLWKTLNKHRLCFHSIFSLITPCHSFKSPTIPRISSQTFINNLSKSQFKSNPHFYQKYRTNWRSRRHKVKCRVAVRRGRRTAKSHRVTTNRPNQKLLKNTTNMRRRMSLLQMERQARRKRARGCLQIFNMDRRRKTASSSRETSSSRRPMTRLEMAKSQNRKRSRRYLSSQRSQKVKRKKNKRKKPSLPKFKRTNRTERLKKDMFWPRLHPIRMWRL